MTMPLFQVIEEEQKDDLSLLELFKMKADQEITLKYISNEPILES